MNLLIKTINLQDLTLHSNPLAANTRDFTIASETDSKSGVVTFLHSYVEHADKTKT